MKVELKKIKELNTGAFTAELWIDGNLAAGVDDDGRGGAYRYRWADRMHGKSDLESGFKAWIEAQPMIAKIRPTPDIWVAAEIDRMELKRKCARNTLIRLVGDGPEQYRSFTPAWKFTPTVAEQIRKDYGTDLLEIVNERYTDPTRQVTRASRRATVNNEGFTSCCDAMTTYSGSVECCKGCWEEVITEEIK